MCGRLGCLDRHSHVLHASHAAGAVKPGGVHCVSLPANSDTIATGPHWRCLVKHAKILRLQRQMLSFVCLLARK